MTFNVGLITGTIGAPVNRYPIYQKARDIGGGGETAQRWAVHLFHRFVLFLFFVFI